MQVLDDERIRILDEYAAPRLYFRDKRAVRQNRHQDWQIVLLCHLHVFLTEGRSHVDQP